MFEEVWEGSVKRRWNWKEHIPSFCLISPYCKHTAQDKIHQHPSLAIMTEYLFSLLKIQQRIVLLCPQQNCQDFTSQKCNTLPGPGIFRLHSEWNVDGIIARTIFSPSKHIHFVCEIVTLSALKVISKMFTCINSRFTDGCYHYKMKTRFYRNDQ